MNRVDRQIVSNIAGWHSLTPERVARDAARYQALVASVRVAMPGPLEPQAMLRLIRRITKRDARQVLAAGEGNAWRWQGGRWWPT